MEFKWFEDPELFQSWVFRIASRAAFRHLKREKRRELHEELVPQPAFDPSPPIELLQQLDNSAISPASRAVLVLHFHEDMSLPDVAAVLEIPLGTVTSRILRAIDLTFQNQSRVRDVELP